MKSTLLVYLFIFSGCASIANNYTEKVMGPNGKDAYIVECRSSLSKCYKRAQNACPGGYNVIESSQKSAGAVPVANMVAVMTDTTMVIECK